MNKKKLLVIGALIFTFSLGNALNVQAQELRLDNKASLHFILDKKIKLNSGVADYITPSVAYEVIEKVDSLKEMYPDLTESDMSNLVVYYLNQRYGDGNIIQTASSGLPYESRLNQKEKELFKANVLKGTRALNYAHNAETRAKARYISESLYQGNGDAFRHALWNALMAKDLGASYAKQWGDAHEYGQSGIDPEMDLYNNSKGRTIVTSVAGGMDSSYWQPRLETELIKNIDNGKLKRIVKNRLIWTDSSQKK